VIISQIPDIFAELRKKAFSEVCVGQVFFRLQNLSNITPERFPLKKQKEALGELDDRGFVDTKTQLTTVRGPLRWDQSVSNSVLDGPVYDLLSLIHRRTSWMQRTQKSTSFPMLQQSPVMIRSTGSNMKQMNFSFLFRLIESFLKGNRHCGS
jgi:hypothetical protein